jgi:hypothetical protein
VFGENVQDFVPIHKPNFDWRFRCRQNDASAQKLRELISAAIRFTLAGNSQTE